MLEGYQLNPVDEFVRDLRYQIKDNGGYCIYRDKNTKTNKCPKPCRNREDACMCGMYIKTSEGDAHDYGH